MKLFKIALCTVGLCLLSTPVWAATQTYYGGFEDTIGGDSDYNDLVFSLTANNLVLHSSSGVWFSKPVLNGAVYPSPGTPFWNNGSSDGPNDNVGFCIYGGPAGACGGHNAGLDTNADYLATGIGGSANDVTFTAGCLTPINCVATDVEITITADTDELGWENVDGVGGAHFFSGTGIFDFTPDGSGFEILGDVTNTSTVYASNSSGQFAWFAASPEPSSLMLLGTGLLGLAGTARRRFMKK